MAIGARRTGLSITKTADLLGFLQPSSGLTENSPMERKYTVDGSCVEENVLWKTAWRPEKGNSDSNNHLLQPRCAE